MNSDSPKDAAPSGPGQYFRAHPKLRRRSLWGGAIALVFVAILVALPMVVARVATTWLQDNGASGASIDNVDINLFTGTVRLFDLEASGAERQRLHIGQAEVAVRWLPLASKRIHVEAIRLSDAQIDIATDARGNWQIGGVLISPAETAAPEASETDADAGFSWGIGSETVELADVMLSYRDTVFDTDIAIYEIALGGHYSWLAEQSTELVVDMDINDSPIRLRSDVEPWSEERSITGAINLIELDLAMHSQAFQRLVGLENMRGTVSLDLMVTASLDEQGVFDLLITGPVDLTGLGFSLDSLSLSNELIDWEGQVDLKLPAREDEPLLNVDGELRLLGTRVTQEGMALTNQTLDWQGRVNLYSTPTDQNLLQVAGNLELQALEAQLDSLDLAFSLGQLELSPDLELITAAGDEPLAVMLQAGLAGQALTLAHTDLPFDIARLDSFSVTDIQATDTSSGTAGQFELQGLHLLTGGEDADDITDVLALDTLTLVAPAFSLADGLAIESVNLAGPALAIVRNENGDLDRITELQAAFASESEPASGEDVAADVPASEPLAFSIGDVQIQATNLLAFEDRAVTPPVSFQLTTLDLGIGNIDSASATPMTLRLLTGNGNMDLSVEGSMGLLQEPLAVNLVANLSALELPRFSSYIPGYNIDRGRLSSDSTISIMGDELDLQNSVVLEQIRLAGKAAGDNAVLGQGMAMPLDVALDLLRDNDDRITLDLPVTGSLSDPQFDSADIVRTVMQNALQNAAMSYVTTALQPLGTLLFIGGLASEAAAPRFAPLEMAAGESTLVPVNREYLLKISDLLTERPSLQLSLCGIATEADREVLAARALAALIAETEAAAVEAPVDPTQDVAAPEAPVISDADLLELAASRTNGAMAFLANEAGIDDMRLFTCRETIDTAEDGIPRVRISL